MSGKIIARWGLAAGLLAAVVSAPASTVLGNLRNVQGGAYSTNVLFTPLSTPQVEGNNVIASTTTNVIALADGSFSVVLEQGDYKVNVGNLVRDTFNISVPNDANTYQITALITKLMNYNRPTHPIFEEKVNKGVANGYAPLGADGLVPDEHLPEGNQGGSSLSSGNIVWVDAVNGNDNTGQRGRSDKPFLGVTNAIHAAVAGDLVVVMPGTFVNTNVTTSLFKPGVNLHLEEGALVRIGLAADAPTRAPVFHDAAGPLTNVVSGLGRFEVINQAQGLMLVTNPLSHVRFDFEEAEATNAGLGRTLFDVRGGDVVLGFRQIRNLKGHAIFVTDDQAAVRFRLRPGGRVLGDENPIQVNGAVRADRGDIVLDGAYVGIDRALEGASVRHPFSVAGNVVMRNWVVDCNTNHLSQVVLLGRGAPLFENMYWVNTNNSLDALLLINVIDPGLKAHLRDCKLYTESAIYYPLELNNFEISQVILENCELISPNMTTAIHQGGLVDLIGDLRVDCITSDVMFSTEGAVLTKGPLTNSYAGTNVVLNVAGMAKQVVVVTNALRLQMTNILTFTGRRGSVTLYNNQPTNCNLVTVAGDPGSGLRVMGASVSTVEAGKSVTIDWKTEGTNCVVRFGQQDVAIADDSVTFAKLQNLTTDRLVGRDTAGTGDPEQLTVGGGVEFTGSGGIQRSALTGDVTASAGSGSTTIGNAAVTYAKIQNVTSSRLLGRATAGAGVLEEITLGTGLSLAGTTLNASGAAFGETSLADLVGNQIIWNGANATRTLTAGLSGASDPVLTFANALVSLNVGFTVGGNLTAQADLIAGGNLTVDGWSLHSQPVTNAQTTRMVGLATSVGPVAYTSSTISGTDIDWAGSSSRYKQLTGNTTFTFSNLADDRHIWVELQQDSVGTRTATWPTATWLGPTNQVGAVGINTNAGLITVFHFWRRSGTVYAEVSGAANEFMTVLENGTATSADLAAHLSNESGTGVFALTDSPVFTTVMTLPYAAAPVTDANGEIAIDSTITGHKGLPQYYTGGATEMVVLAVPRSALTTTDGQILRYNAGAGNLDFTSIGAAGDSVLVNATAATDSVSLTNTAATATVAGTTWTIAGGTDPDPDKASVAIGAASATVAGIVTAQDQAFGGVKSFDNVNVIGTENVNSLNITNNNTFIETTHFLATNSTANTNFTLDVNKGAQTIFLTNNISITNFTGFAAGTMKTVTIHLYPTLANRTIVWPALGTPGNGIYWRTNEFSPMWTTATNGKLVVISMEWRNTNCVASCSEWE